MRSSRAVPVLLNLSIFAPVPVGNHVTVIPLERRALLDFSGQSWVPTQTGIVCDDDTRIVYTARGVGHESMTYDAIAFAPDSNVRVSQSQPPLRGRVTSCVVRSDQGDSVFLTTILGVEPDPTGYR